MTNYPGIYVPPMPRSRLLGAFKEESLLKDMRFLNWHMDAVVHHPLLRRSLFVENFLREEDEMKFELYKKMTSTLPSHSNAENISTVDGIAYCNPSLSNEYANTVESYFDPSHKVTKDAKKQTQKVEGQLDYSAASIKKLASTTGDLRVMQGISPDNKTEVEMYKFLEDAFNSWAACELKRKKTLGKHLDAFFKYKHNEALPFKDLLKERDAALKLYTKSEGNLNSRKDKLWVKGDMKNWEMDPNDTQHDPNILQKDKTLAFAKMLHEETKGVRKLRDFYAYLNYKLKEEAE